GCRDGVQLVIRQVERAGRVGRRAQVDRPAGRGGVQLNPAAAVRRDRGRGRGPQGHAVGLDVDGVAAAVADGGVVREEGLRAAGGQVDGGGPGADVVVNRQVAAGRADGNGAVAGGDATDAVHGADGQVVGVGEGESLAGAGDDGGQRGRLDVVGLVQRHGVDRPDDQVGDGNGPDVRN